MRTLIISMHRFGPRYTVALSCGHRLEVTNPRGESAAAFYRQADDLSAVRKGRRETIMSGMAQPRYSDQLKRFINQWRPNNPELDKRFTEDVRALVAAIVTPPAGAFEVETILTDKGGVVILRVADYEAQLEPLNAQHLALSLVEAATSARLESWLSRFMQEQINLDRERALGMIAHFRQYRTEEMQKELEGDFEKRSVPIPPRAE